MWTQKGGSISCQSRLKDRQHSFRMHTEINYKVVDNRCDTLGFRRTTAWSWCRRAWVSPTKNDVLVEVYASTGWISYLCRCISFVLVVLSQHLLCMTLRPSLVPHHVSVNSSNVFWTLTFPFSYPSPQSRSTSLALIPILGPVWDNAMMFWILLFISGILLESVNKKSFMWGDQWSPVE